MAFNINDVGLFIPTTILFDVDRAIEAEPGSDEDRELQIRLYQAINNIILALNLKDTGYYLVQEFVTGSVYFNVNNDFNNLRQVYRIEVNFGALSAAGTKSVAHNIPNITVGGTTTFSFVKIYAVATNPTAVTFIPIPYSSAAAVTDNLEITVDSTNVNITTGGKDYSAYTITLVTLEYIKE
jgi:hypothetical protein